MCDVTGPNDDKCRAGGLALTTAIKAICLWWSDGAKCEQTERHSTLGSSFCVFGTRFTLQTSIKVDSNVNYIEHCRTSRHASSAFWQPSGSLSSLVAERKNSARARGRVVARDQDERTCSEQQTTPRQLT